MWRQNCDIFGAIILLSLWAYSHIYKSWQELSKVQMSAMHLTLNKDSLLTISPFSKMIPQRTTGGAFEKTAVHNHLAFCLSFFFFWKFSFSKYNGSNIGTVYSTHIVGVAAIKRPFHLIKQTSKWEEKTDNVSSLTASFYDTHSTDPTHKCSPSMDYGI